MKCISFLFVEHVVCLLEGCRFSQILIHHQLNRLGQYAKGACGELGSHVRGSHSLMAISVHNIDICE